MLDSHDLVGVLVARLSNLETRVAEAERLLHETQDCLGDAVAALNKVDALNTQSCHNLATRMTAEALSFLELIEDVRETLAPVVQRVLPEHHQVADEFRRIVADARRRPSASG